MCFVKELSQISLNRQLQHFIVFMFIFRLLCALGIITSIQFVLSEIRERTKNDESFKVFRITRIAITMAAIFLLMTQFGFFLGLAIC